MGCCCGKGGKGAAHLAVVASGGVPEVEDEAEVGIGATFVGSEEDGVPERLRMDGSREGEHPHNSGRSASDSDSVTAS